jgi:exopolysaccharide biosynthesis polyprenyl glycosylphosphotransferase
VLTEQELAVRHIPAPRTLRPRLRLAAFAPAVPRTATPAPISLRSWCLSLAAFDLFIAVAAVAMATASRFGETAALAPAVPYLALFLVVPPLWLAILAAGGLYRQASIGPSADLGRILNAGLWLLAILVFSSYVTHAQLSRAVLAIAVPAIIGLTLAGRVAAGSVLRRQIRAGGTLHRVVVAGTQAEVRDLADHFSRLPNSGVDVAGVCVPGRGRAGTAIGGYPVLGSVRQIVAAARHADADTIAIAGSSTLSGAHLRRLSWDLEGTGICLLVASGATALAGPRLLVRPLGRLPLLEVKEAEFTGAKRLLKEVIDRAGASFLLVALSPALVAITVAVATTSRGGVIYRQTRVGKDGREFGMLKFRTMFAGAERHLLGISQLNEHDGVLFKIRRDPRVTSVGRVLRRLSLDELPQLLNVITGSMSLVGPRPPLPAEVERYPHDLKRRRPLVKPGMTGLWQVSGRSDLPWEETVRLDMEYVENWSVLLDLSILWKTASAVFTGRGAY